MLAEYGRVDTSANAEKVFDGLIVVEGIEVIVQHLGSNERDLGQEVADILEGTMKTLGQNVDLGPVTGAEYYTFGHIRPQG